MNPEDTQMIELLQRLETFVQTGFDKINERFEKSDRVMDALLKRIEGVENAQASAGLIKPSAMLMGIIAAIGLIMGMVTTGATLSAAWVSAQTGKRAAEEKVVYMERHLDELRLSHTHELEQERRITQNECNVAHTKSLLAAALHANN